MAGPHAGPSVPLESPLSPIPLEEVETLADSENSDKPEEDIFEDKIIDQALDESVED